VVRFERLQRRVETGSYYLTWSEDSLGLGPNRVPASIFLHPVSLVYQYSWSVPAFRSYCDAFTLNKRGSGIDGVHPDIKSGGYLHLPITLGGRVLNPADAGNFYLNVFPPASIPAEDIPKT